MSRAISLATIVLAFSFAAQASAGKTLKLHARQRQPTSPDSGRFHAVQTVFEWPAEQTAIVVCDMWNEHWCRGATSRVAEMAPRMNEVLTVARAKGVLIIHCPSDCMKYYEGTPGRKLAQAAPPAESRRPIEGWSPLDPKREAPLPIDDADGGCDCQPHCEQRTPWTHQIDVLKIEPGDAITDSREAYNLMRQRGITSVIVMGVHTNMCVLGRPFSIRQMVSQGQRVLLMRDMTDTMYNHESRPYVSHFSGTDLVVEHIERFWCPTITSSDFTGKGEFRFAANKRPHVAILMAEDEYKTEQTLPKFAAENLQKDFRISLIYGSDSERNTIPGIEAVRDADVLVVSVRRRPLPPEQLAVLREHVAKGKAIVGIRTASHAFMPPRDQPTPTGLESWPEFDRDILGGNYTGHHDERPGGGPQSAVTILSRSAHEHILDGVPADPFAVQSTLYKVSPLVPDARPLAIGRIEDSSARSEPVAWTHQAGKSRVFYTSLGGPEDFKLPAFQRLLENGIRWAAAPAEKSQ